MDKIIFSNFTLEQEIDDFPDRERGWGAIYDKRYELKPPMEYFNDALKVIDSNTYQILKDGIIPLSDNKKKSGQFTADAEGIYYVDSNLNTIPMMKDATETIFGKTKVRYNFDNFDETSLDATTQLELKSVIDYILENQFSVAGASKVGHVFWDFKKDPTSLVLDGSKYKKTLYPELWSFATKRNLTIKETDVYRNDRFVDMGDYFTVPNVNYILGRVSEGGDKRLARSINSLDKVVQPSIKGYFQIKFLTGLSPERSENVDNMLIKLNGLSERLVNLNTDLGSGKHRGRVAAWGYWDVKDAPKMLYGSGIKSVTRIATGKYKFELDEPLTNYIVVSNNNSSDSPNVYFLLFTCAMNITENSFEIWLTDNNGDTFYNGQYVNFQVIDRIKKPATQPEFDIAAKYLITNTSQMRVSASVGTGVGGRKYKLRYNGTDISGNQVTIPKSTSKALLEIWVESSVDELNGVTERNIHDVRLEMNTFVGDAVVTSGTLTITSFETINGKYISNYIGIDPNLPFTTAFTFEEGFVPTKYKFTGSKKTTFNASKLNFLNVQEVDYMFDGITIPATNLSTALNFQNIKTFRLARNSSLGVVTFPTTTWGTSITNVNNFANNSTITALNNLKLMDFSKVTSLKNFLYKISGLPSLDLNYIKSSKITDMSEFINECPNFGAFYGFTTMDISNVTTFYKLFYNNTAMHTCDWRGSKPTNVVTTELALSNTSVEGALGLNGVLFPNLKTTKGMYRLCKKLKEVNELKSLIGDKVEDMSEMFYGCTILTNVGGLANANVTNVKTIRGMFALTPLTTTTALNNWRFTKLVDSSYLYYNCTKLTAPSTFLTSYPNTVENYEGMFYTCSVLVNVDLTNLIKSSTRNVRGMLNATPKLTKITGHENWSTGSILQWEGMLGSTGATLDRSKWVINQASDYNKIEEPIVLTY